jgi:hypothetical protein
VHRKTSVHLSLSGKNLPPKIIPFPLSLPQHQSSVSNNNLFTKVRQQEDGETRGHQVKPINPVPLLNSGTFKVQSNILQYIISNIYL